MPGIATVLSHSGSCVSLAPHGKALLIHDVPCHSPRTLCLLMSAKLRNCSRSASKGNALIKTSAALAPRGLILLFVACKATAAAAAFEHFLLCASPQCFFHGTPTAGRKARLPCAATSGLKKPGGRVVDRLSLHSMGVVQELRRLREALAAIEIDLTLSENERLRATQHAIGELYRATGRAKLEGASQHLQDILDTGYLPDPMT